MTVGKATLEGLKSRGLVRRVEAGQVLFTKGDTPDGIYVLLSGRCSASGEDEEQHFIEPGELFGELAPLGGGQRTATVTATEASEVLRITPEEIRQSELRREVMWGWLEDVARRGRDIKEQQAGLIEDKATRRAVQRMRMPSVDLIRQIALRLLPEGLEGYIDGGAGDEITRARTKRPGAPSSSFLMCSQASAIAIPRSKCSAVAVPPLDRRADGLPATDPSGRRTRLRPRCPRGRRGVLPLNVRDHVRQGAAGRASRPRLVVSALLVH
jgi:CRP-like cAMP-binding protein